MEDEDDTESYKEKHLFKDERGLGYDRYIFIKREIKYIMSSSVKTVPRGVYRFCREEDEPPDFFKFKYINISEKLDNFITKEEYLTFIKESVSLTLPQEIIEELKYGEKVYIDGFLEEDKIIIESLSDIGPKRARKLDAMDTPLDVRRTTSEGSASRRRLAWPAPGAEGVAAGTAAGAAARQKYRDPGAGVFSSAAGTAADKMDLTKWGGFGTVVNSTPLWIIFNTSPRVTYEKKQKEDPIPIPGTYNIYIENLKSFGVKIGVGGVAMLFRYFQFLDAVHDFCEPGRCAWSEPGNRFTTYKILGELYAEDIKWMLSQNYSSKKLYPIFSTPRELSNFLQEICLNLKLGTENAISRIVFYNYETKFDASGNIHLKPDIYDDEAPNPSDLSKKTSYLLKKYLDIEKSTGKVTKGAHLCSDALHNGVRAVLGGSGPFSRLRAAVARNYGLEIVYHVDAQSNKTGLCGILEKICDSGSPDSLTIVKYSPDAITSEYDAAWSQASNSYINSLSNLRPKVIEKKESADSINLILRCEDVVLMNLKYETQRVHKYRKIYSALLRCLSGSKFQAIVRDELGGNLKDLKKAIDIFHNDVFVNQTRWRNLLDTTPKTIDEAISYVRNLRSQNKTHSNEVETHLTRINNELPTYTDTDDEFYTSAVKLSVDRAYSKTDTDFRKTDFFNPIDGEPLNGNQNTSLTSSLRAITDGVHYDLNGKLIESYIPMQACKRTNIHKSWFKSVGDLGQILEFHANTRDRGLTLWHYPIFLTFDKLCADLSYFFNPLTILERPLSVKKPPKEPLKEQITGLLFYIKASTSSFGKVNKRYIKQKNISKRLKFMSDSDIKNKLKSVGIKITKTLRGKRKYLSRKELENKAKLFNKIQNTARRMKIKIMYKKNRIYKYKTYKRLQKEIKKMKNKPRNKKMYNSIVKRSSFG